MKETPVIKTIFILGPTATGKTSLGVKLAGSFDGEIISADSRQVYKGLDIGSGKDLSSYSISGKSIPYHLIDIVSPIEEYNLMRYSRDFNDAIMKVHDKNHLPVVVGGSALYVDAIIKNYKLPGGPPDTEMRKKTESLDVSELGKLLKNRNPQIYSELKDKNNRNRLLRAIEKAESGAEDRSSRLYELTPLLLGIYFHRSEVHKRIESRLDERLLNGMVEEVERLHSNGVSWERLEYFGLEYKFAALYLQKKLDYNEMRLQLLAKIRQFAKRQDIWFRKMENEGNLIHWIPGGDFHAAEELVKLFLQDKELPDPVLRLSEIRYGIKTD